MAANIAALLDAALRAAGFPILGVSIGNTDDRSTWTPIFDRTATPQEQAGVSAFIAGFDPESTETKAQTVDSAATTVLDQPIVNAMLLYWLRNTLGKEPGEDAIAAAKAGLTDALKTVLATKA